MIGNNLSSLVGERYRFFATYLGAGFKDDGSTVKDGQKINYLAPTIKLGNVRWLKDDGPRFIPGILTMNYTRRFSGLGQLAPGEIITFMARVAIRSSYFDQPTLSDYTLTYPSKIKIYKSLIGNTQRYPLPKHDEELVGFAMESDKDYYLTHNQFNQSYVDKYDTWCNQQVNKKGSAADRSNAEPQTTTKISNQNRCHKDYDTNSTQKKEGGQ